MNEIPFGVQGTTDGGVQVGAAWRILLNEPCAAAMRPLCTVRAGEERATGRHSEEPCPLRGVYQLSASEPGAGCVYQLDVGCENASLIHAVQSAAVCSNTQSPAFTTAAHGA